MCACSSRLKTVHIVAFYQDFVQSQFNHFLAFWNTLNLRKFFYFGSILKKSLSKALKVSKFQKHFFLKLHCPKRSRKFLKDFCPNCIQKSALFFIWPILRQKSVKNLGGFGGNGVSRKNAFEIYWPLERKLGISWWGN